MATLSKSLSYCLFLLTFFASTAQAVVIPVNPGDVGDRVVDLRFTVGGVGENIIDLVFTDMKHLEYDLPGLSITLFNDSSGVVPTLATGFLSDENGFPIPDTDFVSDIVGSFPGSLLFNYDVPLGGPVPVTFHDMHFEALLGSFGGGDYVLTFNVPGLSPQDLPVVGEWSVPEPGTIALLALGLAGIGASRRKSR